ncbi:hypothetical protein Gbem_0643 [Citrifermentans bemidjiense Bem]|uniref:Uncharacterized protein n=1 Tax=Citrifermentans bemidjiense (strain ATCC BAA-1014 / DSM 16622 / JCM 12645 / Bem) TaxID=404380 RepID=B5ED85_CITBB|nr:hypothetical protein Gbem_0643 [Citrifermentans bemidjiense Bem]
MMKLRQKQMNGNMKTTSAAQKTKNNAHVNSRTRLEPRPAAVCLSKNNLYTLSLGLIKNI